MTSLCLCDFTDQNIYEKLKNSGFEPKVLVKTLPRKNAFSRVEFDGSEGALKILSRSELPFTYKWLLKFEN